MGHLGMRQLKYFSSCRCKDLPYPLLCPIWSQRDLILQGFWNCIFQYFKPRPWLLLFCVKFPSHPPIHQSHSKLLLPCLPMPSPVLTLSSYVTQIKRSSLFYFPYQNYFRLVKNTDGSFRVNRWRESVPRYSLQFWPVPHHKEQQKERWLLRLRDVSVVSDIYLSTFAFWWSWMLLF